MSVTYFQYIHDYTAITGTVCMAMWDAVQEYKMDFDFKKGKKVVIEEPCRCLFFYIAKNVEGKRGIIPINFLSFPRVIYM